MQQIILEGDVARVVELNIIAETSVEQLTPRLVKRAPTILPLCPRNMVSAAYNPETRAGAFLIEQPATTVHLRMHLNGDEDDAHEADADRCRASDAYEPGVFELPMPWTYFLMGFKQLDNPDIAENYSLSDTRVFWRPAKLVEGDTQLWHAHLPNILDTVVCWGDAYDSGSTLVSSIDERVNTFFTTDFNDDYGWNRPIGFDSYTEWESRQGTRLSEWEHWNRAPRTELEALFADYDGNGSARIAADAVRNDTLSPPIAWSTARAREFLNNLDADRRRVFLNAARAMQAEQEAAE